ncbi:MAG: C13 family peptidase [Promethearchaeota archaeon]
MIVFSAIIIAAIVTSIIIMMVMLAPFSKEPPDSLLERKAIILCSANDFYPTEADEDFNGGIDSTFDTGTGNWTYEGDTGVGDHSPVVGNESAGSLFVMSSDNTNPQLVEGSFKLDYEEYYNLQEYAYYNMTAKILIQSGVPIEGPGIRIGLKWLNSTGGLIRSDWSTFKNLPTLKWLELQVNGTCNNETDNEISRLELNLEINATLNPVVDKFYFDDVKIDRWIAVNLTNPTDPGPNPPPSSVDSDGFPAQALQVYWILKDHGYIDEHIFLMLYHTNDPVIDIKAGDGILNDLNGAVIDVENDDVNASRFKHELNVSKSDSFASQITQKDHLIIFMTDHGSNGVLPDGNATFHFEADNSFITEFEFYDLVKNINCRRMMINVDCCFSGNYLNQNTNIGASWYAIPNCLFVSSSSNVFSWYWVNNVNGDGFAGSWFFHQFWEQLDQNQTINNAFNFAINFVPFNRGLPLIVSQKPLMHDNMGINTTWSFISDPPL